MSLLRRIAILSLEESGALRVGQSAWVFGSCRWSLSPSDVDVLLVYHDVDDAAFADAIAFREHVTTRVLAGLGLRADVVLLTCSEEAQIDFALNENAVQVWP